MTSNAELAADARRVAAKAPNGSMNRRALGCLAVALSSTSTLASARKALADVGPADVRAAAVEILDHLAKEEAAPPTEEAECEPADE